MKISTRQHITDFLTNERFVAEQLIFKQVEEARSKIRITAWIVLTIASISGCSSNQVMFDSALNTKEYCDRYFAYQMCAKDFTGNGVVDGMYFEDSRDIFMYREESKELLQEFHNFHICAQAMDEKLTEASSALLEIDEDTSLIKRSELKSSIFLNYMRYASAINQCNSEHGNKQFDPDAEDDFGLPDDDDYADEY